MKSRNNHWGHVLVYDDMCVTEKFKRRFNRLYRWLVKRKWNKEVPCLESGVIDAEYGLINKRFTEEYWCKEGTSKTIKFMGIKIILINAD